MSKRGFDMKAHVRGLRETQRKLEQVVQDIHGQPVMNAIARGTLIVERKAKRNAPVDRGRLRASITPEVRKKYADILEGVVGSNVEYAPYQELGTRPFWPPWNAIFRWAMRKTKGDRRAAGAITYSVRRRIAKEGIKAKRFFQNALQDSQGQIRRLLQIAANEIAGR